MNASNGKSSSAPSTPTELTKQLHSSSMKKKGKRRRVHFPSDEMLVTCYLEPPDPWSKVRPNSLDCILTAYVAACDKQGIKPLSCVVEQLQEIHDHSEKQNADKRIYDFSLVGEKLSVKHCETLEEIFRRIQFEQIDLEGCYLEDEGAASLFDMIEYYDSASHLNISFTKHIDCRGWQACSRMLKKTTSLLHLNARSTALNEQVLLILGRALRLGSNLTTLHLENCGVFGRCLVILVAALKLNTTLRELFLAENKISSSDGFQLGNLLRTNTHLELLDLSNNKLEDDGLIHLMESLGQQSNTSGRGLSTLILWNNKLTHQGMSCVARAVNSARALKRLNLGSNEISSAGIQELKQSFICNQTLESLELENASITCQGAIALAEYIAKRHILLRLDLRGNNIRLEGLKALSKSMKDNHSIVSLQIDYTSMDLNESVKDRQLLLQEISKNCQRNKEEKSYEPAQDAQLSMLFNGIFSRVIPVSLTTASKEVQEANISKDIKGIAAAEQLWNSRALSPVKSRFQVSPVVINNERKTILDGDENAETFLTEALIPMRLLGGGPDESKVTSKSNTESVNIDRSTNLVAQESVDTTIMEDAKICKKEEVENLVINRIRWLEDLSDTKIDNSQSICKNKNAENFQLSPATHGICNNSIHNTDLGNSESSNTSVVSSLENKSTRKAFFAEGGVVKTLFLGKEKSGAAAKLFLPLKETSGLPPVEQKERRLSSPAVPTATVATPKVSHSLKCCKQLEGLDLRSSVPLSPTRLVESFNFPEPDLNDVSLSSQMNIKSSQTAYMVH